MTFVRKKRPELDGAYYPLMELAQRLPISVEHLLQKAGEGWLEVFVRPPEQTRLFSVHEDAVDIDDPRLRVSKAVRHVQPPDEIDSRPGNMSSFPIEGLVLSRTDCHELRAKRCVRKYLFDYGIKTSGNWLEGVNPTIPNFFHESKKLAEEGWRIACYGRYEAIPFIPGVGYSQPIGIDVTAANLFVTMRSIDQFFDGIDTNKYVEELFCDGNVATDRPPYFSAKLNYLIDVSERFWRTRTPDSSADDIAASRLRAQAKLASDDFRSLFKKGEASDEAVDAAVRFITPVFARKLSTEEERKASPGYITPEMLTLMAAAKLFWGASHVDMAAVDTHPKKEHIDKWLRRMGLKDNDPSTGTTILRPEAAVFGKPIRKVAKSRPIIARRPATKS